jgi:dTDP-glucose 4,6-dehydratase
MRVLCTGDRGFIGSHLTHELREHGYEVVGHDRSEGDLAAPGVFATHLEIARPELVIHLAAQPGRLFCEDDIADAIRLNVTMTTLVAYACGRAAVPVLFASTSEVYGDHGEETCSEGSPFAKPTGIYALGKRWAEDAVRLYAPEGLKIIRPTMPYGPGAPPAQRGRRALDTFLWQAHHRLPIHVHERSERSWCHISDVARGIRLVIENGEPGIYNIGRDDDPRPMLEIAEMACELAGAPRSLIEIVSLPPHTTAVKRLSTEKLRSLGWEPKVELEEGMSLLLDWVRRFDAEGKLCSPA